MKHSAIRLAELILAGVPELYAADVGTVAPRNWRYLTAAARLEAQEPFGFPAYWTPTTASHVWAMRTLRGRSDAERAAAARRRALRRAHATPARRTA